MSDYCPNCDQEVEAPDGRCPRCQGPVVRDRRADLIGQVVDGRYEVLGRLGRGGMGEVYVVRQRIIDRVVALKVLRHDLIGQKELVQRFLREARAMGRLTSVHTIRLYDFGVTGDGTPYFTMEYLEGEPLSERMKRERRLDPGFVLDVALQVCASLQEAHGKGILHRDLKPENIFLVATPEGPWQVHVLDFGIAKILDDEGPATKAGQLVGTPRYVAPEVLRGDPIDARADIYALALMMYEMLSGEAAFEGTTALEVLAAKLNSNPPHLREARPDPDCPTELCDLVMRASDPDPSRRPPSVEAFSRCLLAIHDRRRGEPVTEPPPPQVEEGATRLRLETLVSPGPAARLPEAPLPAGPVADAGDSLPDLTLPVARSRRWMLVGAALLALGFGVALWTSLREPPAAAPGASTPVQPTPSAPEPTTALPAAPAELAPPPASPPSPPPEVEVAPAPAALPKATKAAPRPQAGKAAWRPEPDEAPAAPTHGVGDGGGLFRMKAVDPAKASNPFELKPVGNGPSPSPRP